MSCHCCGSSPARHGFYTEKNTYLHGGGYRGPDANLCDVCWKAEEAAKKSLKRNPTTSEVRSYTQKLHLKPISSSSSSSSSTSSATSIAARSIEHKVTTRASLNNWTIVRVWLPKDADGKFCVAHSAKNVGHASLETSEIYASFWPEWQVKTRVKVALASKAHPKLGAVVDKFNVVLGTAKGVNHDSLQLDVELEGGPPEVVVVLSSLSTTKIAQSLNSFLKSSESKKWSLCGSNVFNIFNGGAGQSCSGLVYDLLKAGGLFENLDYPSDWTTNFTVAPDGVAKMVIRASEYEKEQSLQKQTTVKSKFGTFQMMVPRCELNFHTWSIGWWLSGGSFEPKYPTYTPVQPKKS